MSYNIGQIEGDGVNVVETATAGATTFAIKNFPVINGENGWLQVTYACADSTGLGAIKLRMFRFKRSMAGLITISNTTDLYVPAADSGMTTANFTLTVSGDGASLNLNVVGVTGKDVKHRVQTVKNSVALDAFASI